MDQKKALEKLSEAAVLLNNHGIKWWLTDGTLLGYYRDGKILKHDDDLDIGCFADEYDKSIEQVFLKNGWQFLHSFGTPDMGLEISFEKDGIKLDIFYFYKTENVYWSGAWQKYHMKGKQVGRNLIRYNFKHFEVIPADFKNVPVNIPSQCEDFIQSKYGSNWVKTQVKWDWRFGPSNAEKTNIVMFDGSRKIHYIENITKLDQKRENTYQTSMKIGRQYLKARNRIQARKCFKSAWRAYHFRTVVWGFILSTYLSNQLIDFMEPIWKWVQKKWKITV